MLRASAVEQGGLASFCATKQNLAEDGFGPGPRFHVLLASAGGKPAGLALYFYIYSTWTSRNGLYLEDLYIKPRYRKQGLARALMERLQAIAVENGCGRMMWLVLRDNPAVGFYRSIGAAALKDWMPMQMKI
ncbi:MAG: GNAT family N-acetyltransferase [Acidobacteria bacterium]|nr:GNAT family N-acetyltransferase [Acidobacteriota bacterium]